MQLQLLFLLLLLPDVLSQRVGYQLKRWQESRFWYWADNAPMTKALNAYPDIVNGVEMIQAHFERVETAILHRLGTRQPSHNNELLRPCFSTDRFAWPRAVNNNFGARGFPEPDLSCITDFFGTKLDHLDVPPFNVDELYEATLNRGLAIQRNAKAIASNYVDTKNNFTAPDFVFNYLYRTTSLKCVLHPVHGVRADGRWRIATGIHNRPKTESLKLDERKNIVEYHRVVDGVLGDNLLMRLPERPKTGTKRIIHENATTLIVNARGHSNPSMYRFIPIEENPAMFESLEMASVSIQQAEDAVTLSNVAILALPLALNLVPITLFAPVNTVKMMLYLILTDMLTVIPLLIKGIELIQIQGTTHRAVVLRVSSAFNSTPPNAAAAEMWATECQARENVRHTGIIFVTLSAIFLVLGVLLELVARKYMKKRKWLSKVAKLGAWSIESSSSGKYDRLGVPSQAPSEYDSDDCFAVPAGEGNGLQGRGTGKSSSQRRSKRQLEKPP